MSQILKSRDRWKRTDGALSGMYVARFNHAALYREHFPRSDSSFCFYQTCTGDSSVSLPAESLRVYPPSACQSPPLYLFTSIPTFPGNGRVVQQSSLHVTGRGQGWGWGWAGSRLCPVKHCTEIQHVSNKDVLLSKWCRSLYFKNACKHSWRACVLLFIWKAEDHQKVPTCRVRTSWLILLFLFHWQSM